LYESGTPANKALAGVTIRTKGMCLANKKFWTQIFTMQADLKTNEPHRLGEKNWLIFGLRRN